MQLLDGEETRFTQGGLILTNLRVRHTDGAGFTSITLPEVCSVSLERKRIFPLLVLALILFALTAYYGHAAIKSEEVQQINSMSNNAAVTGGIGAVLFICFLALQRKYVFISSAGESIAWQVRLLTPIKEAAEFVDILERAKLSESRVHTQRFV